MNDPVSELRARIATRHALFGWWGLFLFIVLGLTLEALHGYKVGSYLDPGAKIRRLMWTLSHAHGTLIAIINIAFSVTVMNFGTWNATRLKLASFFLIDALILLPLGFFLGGVGHTGVDPSPGVILVAVGGVLLIIAVGLIAMANTIRKKS